MWIRTGAALGIYALLAASLDCRPPEAGPRATLSPSGSGSAPSPARSTAAPAPAETSRDATPMAPASPTGVLLGALPAPKRLEACVAQVPLAPSFQTVSNVATIKSELVVAWQLTEGAPIATGRAAPDVVPSTVVRLALQGEGIEWTTALGTHAGHPYSADISFCVGRQRGRGPCSRGNRRRVTPGVVSDLSVQSWVGYLQFHAVRWLLARTGSGIVVMTTQTRGELFDRETAECAPDTWRRQMEIQLGPGVSVREKVLVGSPGRPFDCARSDEEDTRCAG